MSEVNKIEVFDRNYLNRRVVGSRPDGTEIALLFYLDATIRIHHECKQVGEHRMVCAPALRVGNGHVIENMDPVTISPSILCPDCDLHGYVRAGRWESC